MTPRAVLLEIVIRALYPGMLVVSVWILLRGHNEPGGGFVGGMIAVAATAVLAVAAGSARALQRLPLGAVGLTSTGVLVALLSGLAAAGYGLPFMTHLWGTLPLGWTRLDVSTVLLFDLGVYLAVWGALGGLAAHMIAIDEGERR